MVGTYPNKDTLDRQERQHHLYSSSEAGMGPPPQYYIRISRSGIPLSRISFVAYRLSVLRFGIPQEMRPDCFTTRVPYSNHGNGCRPCHHPPKSHECRRSKTKSLNSRNLPLPASCKNSGKYPVNSKSPDEVEGCWASTNCKVCHLLDILFQLFEKAAVWDWISSERDNIAMDSEAF